MSKLQIRTEHCGPLSSEGSMLANSINRALKSIIEEAMNDGIGVEEIVGLVASEALNVASRHSLSTRFESGKCDEG